MGENFILVHSHLVRSVVQPCTRVTAFGMHERVGDTVEALATSEATNQKATSSNAEQPQINSSFTPLDTNELGTCGSNRDTVNVRGCRPPPLHALFFFFNYVFFGVFSSFSSEYAMYNHVYVRAPLPEVDITRFFP
jgi:hypothetical protein